MEEKQYITLQPIWHTGEGRQYGPGELVTLDHLPASRINRLVANAVVAEAGELLAIHGIGPERLRVLILAGVTTLEALAEVDPEAVDLPLKQLRAWKAEARRLVEAGRGEQAEA
jgi:hypothetical protein